MQLGRVNSGLVACQASFFCGKGSTQTLESLHGTGQKVSVITKLRQLAVNWKKLAQLFLSGERFDLHTCPSMAEDF
jgi:hypothetical protein